MDSKFWDKQIQIQIYKKANRQWHLIQHNTEIGKMILIFNWKHKMVKYLIDQSSIQHQEELLKEIDLLRVWSKN